ncbi:hypothetical protein CERSUDRAFT_118470 [Gelatoporia subvermispora B]|uniref:Mixed lineage kinase domain-containing protein n=1 Tax=Ceriporiopsis subvermispora (strain B) TaxID=914234 RepID=M2PB06_CERS8|nr:hypothetical protein CERSUDRAFT_118470 [Gelatoporia subvermispora B]
MAPLANISKDLGHSTATTPKKRQRNIFRQNPFANAKSGTPPFKQRKRQPLLIASSASSGAPYSSQSPPPPPPAPVPFPRVQPPVNHAAPLQDTYVSDSSAHQPEQQTRPHIISPIPVQASKTAIPFIVEQGYEHRHRIRSPSSPTVGSVVRSAVRTPPVEALVYSSSWTLVPSPIERSHSVPPIHPGKGRSSHEDAAKAFTKAVGTAVDVTLDVLDYAAELLTLAPVPGLKEGIDTVLKVANAAKSVKQNKQECERLARRCVAVMLSVRQEVKLAGDQVSEELAMPISDLVRTFTSVYHFLQGYGHASTFQKYMKRWDVSNDFRDCDRSLDSAISLFGMALQIRMMKQMIQMGTQRREIRPTPRLIPLPPSPPPDGRVTTHLQRTLKSRPAIRYPAPQMDRTMLSFGSAETVDPDSMEPSPAPQRHLTLVPYDPPDVQEMTGEEPDPYLREHAMLTRGDVEQLRQWDNATGSSDGLKHVKLHRPSREMNRDNATDFFAHNHEVPVVAIDEPDTGRVHIQRANRERRMASRARPAPALTSSPTMHVWASQHTLVPPSKDVAILAFQEMGIEVVGLSQTKFRQRPSRPPLSRPKSMEYCTGSKATLTNTTVKEVNIDVVFAKHLTNLAAQRLLRIRDAQAVETRPLLERLRWSYHARGSTV